MQTYRHDDLLPDYICRFRPTHGYHDNAELEAVLCIRELSLECDQLVDGSPGRHCAYVDLEVTDYRLTDSELPRQDNFLIDHKSIEAIQDIHVCLEHSAYTCDHLVYELSGDDLREDHVLQWRSFHCPGYFNDVYQYTLEPDYH